jgi:uracil-DNA glycosylase
VHRTLDELGVADDVVLWNVVPTHPGSETSNRRPTSPEIDASRPFLDAVTRGRRILAIGRIAQVVTGAPYVRHPSHGGAAEFAAMLRECLT